MTFYIYAALLSWTGKWLNGVANTTSILRILAYAMFPTILSLVIVIFQIALFGNEMFQSEISLEDKGVLGQAFFYCSLLVEIALVIWTVCFVVVGISEVQKISIGKSILNILLPGLLIVGIVLLFVLAFS